MSFSVTLFPASCVDNLRRSSSWRISISGWWFSRSANSPTCTTKSKHCLKESNLMLASSEFGCSWKCFIGLVHLCDLHHIGGSSLLNRHRSDFYHQFTLFHQLFTANHLLDFMECVIRTFHFIVEETCYTPYQT